MAIFGLVGTGGFGREVMPLLIAASKDRSTSSECVLVDVKLPTKSIDGVTSLLEAEFLANKLKKLFNVAIGDYKIRKKVVEKFLLEGCEPVSIISPTSLILDRVDIGVGAILCNFTHLTSDIKIGDYFHCNIYSYVGHDCVIGNYVTFAPKVTRKLYFDPKALMPASASLPESFTSNPKA